MASEAYYTIITQLPHRLRVMRMYRYGLRELLSYSSNRLEWFPRAQALRLEFEANRHLVRLLGCIRRPKESQNSRSQRTRSGSRAHPSCVPRRVLQTDRNEIKRCVDLGEDLLSRFKHWEPLISE